MKITRKFLLNLINEELDNVLQEGLLEDPIEQSGSTILSMLDTRGFRTRGFIEELISTIKMEAERGGTAPNAVMEDELLKFRRGLDDLADRLAGRLRTHFPPNLQLGDKIAR